MGLERRSRQNVFVFFATYAKVWRLKRVIPACLGTSELVGQREEKVRVGVSGKGA